MAAVAKAPRALLKSLRERGEGAGPVERRGDERCEELNRRNCGPQLLKSSREQNTSDILVS